MTWCLHGAWGRHWDSVMWSKPQARGRPRPRLDNNTTQHEEESLSSQELGTSTWGGIQNWEQTERVGRGRDREGSARSCTLGSKPNFSSCFLPPLRSYSELHHVKQENYSGWRCGVESGEQASRHHLLLNTCADPQLPRRSLWEKV